MWKNQEFGKKITFRKFFRSFTREMSEQSLRIHDLWKTSYLSRYPEILLRGTLYYSQFKSNGGNI